MNVSKLQNVFFAVLAVVITGLVMMEPAFAGTDNTFGAVTGYGSGSATAKAGPLVTVIGWMEGSLGILISILALVMAVISAISGKLQQVMVAVGVAIVAQAGPKVLASMFSATLPLI